MRIERSATSISWIPSESIPGLLKLPFARGVMHYDPPPPLSLTDVEGMRRRGEFRFANRLSAYIDVEDGRITGCGYTGGKLMGLTPITAGPLRVMLPTKGNRDIQWQPAITTDQVTFVQTAGGRPGFSFLKPQWRWPFFVTRPFTIWTTVRLTIDVTGACIQALVGASPFPRHWLYDDGGVLVQKSALTRSQIWARTAFGTHTPWGGEDEMPDVAEAETSLERELANQLMQQNARPAIRQLHPGNFLFRQDEQGTSVAVVLDGIFEVGVDGRVVGHVGPGSVVGERAPLEAGRRTASVRATTDVRIAEVPAGSLDLELLSELAQGHHREDP
jgi:Cyclic nucleotide-binding domain